MGVRLLLGLAALLGMVSWAPAAHAVAVSPLVLVIDHTTREGTLTLHNPGPVAEEVTLDFVFGYPVSDATGRISVPLYSVAPPGEPSAVEWLRAYPRRIVLGPDEVQTVRVLARPPAGIAEAEYWARLRVTSTPAPPAVETAGVGAVASVQVGTRIVLGVQYRVGTLETGVGVASTSAERDTAGAVLTLDLERQGRAAYLGSVRVEAVTADGRVVGAKSEGLSLFRTLRYRVRVPVLEPELGRVVGLRYTITAERPDLGGRGVIAAPVASGTVPLPVGGP